MRSRRSLSTQAPGSQKDGRLSRPFEGGRKARFEFERPKLYWPLFCRRESHGEPAEIGRNLEVAACVRRLHRTCFGLGSEQGKGEKAVYQRECQFGVSIGFGTGPRIGFQSGPLWAVITPAELVRVARPG